MKTDKGRADTPSSGTDLVVLLVSHKILHLTGFKLVTTVQTVYNVMRERRTSALLAVVVHTSGGGNGQIDDV